MTKHFWMKCRRAARRPTLGMTIVIAGLVLNALWTAVLIGLAVDGVLWIVG